MFNPLKLTAMIQYEYTIEKYTDDSGDHEVVAIYHYHVGMKSSDPNLVPHDEDEVEVIDVLVRTPNSPDVSIGWSDLYCFILDKSDLEIEIYESHIP